MEPVARSARVAVQDQLRHGNASFPVPDALGEACQCHLHGLEGDVRGFVDEDRDVLVSEDFLRPFRIVQPARENGRAVGKQNRKFAFLKTAEAVRQMARNIRFERVVPERCLHVCAAFPCRELPRARILQGAADQVFRDQGGFPGAGSAVKQDPRFFRGNQQFPAFALFRIELQSHVRLLFGFPERQRKSAVRLSASVHLLGRDPHFFCIFLYF